jgi:molybdenum cofactor cytidylyltransferase
MEERAPWASGVRGETVQLIRCNDAASLGAVMPGAVLCHDVRDPAQPRTVVVRKGRRLDAQDLARLREVRFDEIHVLVPEPSDLLEDEAAARIAAAVAGDGVRLTEPHYGQVNLIAQRRGWLRVNQCGMEQVNVTDGALLFTSIGERAADEGEVVGGVKCAPLVLAGDVNAALDAYRAEHGPVVEVVPFPERSIALVALDRLGETTLDSARTALGKSVAWFGSRLDPVIIVPAQGCAPAEAYRQAVADGASAILVAGASATDPLDAAFEGLRQAGGTVDQIGIPIEPGTACWTGRIAGRQVLGLASCELFGRPGAVDLLLPRLVLGEPLDRRSIARLAAGGLVESLPVHRALT